MSKNFLDEQGLQKITAAVSEAEKGTSGEIVVVAADRSGSWAGPRTAFALGVGAIVTVAAAGLNSSTQATWLLALFPVTFAAAYVLAGVPFVLRGLLTDDAVDEGVLRAAKVAFVDHGVHRTRQRAGVLVYVSLFERRVQILGDAGVHKVVGDDGWRGYADAVVAAMHDRDIDNLVAVVRDVGNVLARAFPPESNNPNELPDAVRST